MAFLENAFINSTQVSTMHLPTYMCKLNLQQYHKIFKRHEQNLTNQIESLLDNHDTLS